jgi:uncharacterized integral membrane protein
MPKKKSVRKVKSSKKRALSKTSVPKTRWNPIWTYLTIVLLLCFLVAYFYITNNEGLNNDDLVNPNNLPNVRVDLDSN